MKTLFCGAILLGLIAPSFQHLICKSRDSSCTVGKNECCNDLACKKKTSSSRQTTCQPTSGLCNRENDDCTPVLDPCCNGLKCSENMWGNFKCKKDFQFDDCKEEDEECDSDCCQGLVCKTNLLGNRKCDKISSCKLDGISCTPGLASECCSDLTCQETIPGSSSFVCKVPCRRTNEKCTIGVNSCCAPFKCKREDNLSGTVCKL